MFEGFDAFRGTFGQRFDATVIEVLYEPDDLMTCRGPLHKEAETYALYVAADKESSRDSIVHRLCPRWVRLAIYQFVRLYTSDP